MSDCIDHIIFQENRINTLMHANSKTTPKRCLPAVNLQQFFSSQVNILHSQCNRIKLLKSSHIDNHKVKVLNLHLKIQDQPQDGQISTFTGNKRLSEKRKMLKNYHSQKNRRLYKYFIRPEEIPEPQIERILEEVTEDYKFQSISEVWKFKTFSAKKKEIKAKESGGQIKPPATAHSKVPEPRSRPRVQKNPNAAKFHDDPVYNSRIDAYFDFIFKINFSNRIYVNLVPSQTKFPKYKVFVAPGNNHHLIRTLFDKRWWVELTNAPEQVHLLWTQSTKLSFFQQQKNAVPNLQLPLQKKSQKIVRSHSNNLKIMKMQDSVSLDEPISKRQRHKFGGYQKERLCIDFKRQYQRHQRRLREINPYELRIHNHIPNNSCITNKKGLLRSIADHCRTEGISQTDIIPLTFEVSKFQSKEFIESSSNSKRHWICKPGQNSNRGTGIFVTNNVSQILNKLKCLDDQRTFVVQEYIQNPLLYQGRKFDIRHYMLLTSVQGALKAYWYSDGYIRTSSFQFNISNLANLHIHLTNDAIQKTNEGYGKYEQNNKLSYSQFQRYLDSFYRDKKINFATDILSRMKELALTVIKAAAPSLLSTRKEANFQLLGLDFMIDSNFKVWLIEINTNPCLQTSCPILQRIIPTLLEQTLRVGVDPLLVPQETFPVWGRNSLSDNFLQNLKYSLIFDELYSAD